MPTQTFQGNLTGNAATVTTNANLTGDVTSVGNATTIKEAPAIKAPTFSLGSELVLNGTFTTDTSDWTAITWAGVGGTIAAVGGELVCTGGAISGRVAAQQIVTLTAGKTYIFSAQQKNGTSTGVIGLGTAFGDTSIFTTGAVSNATLTTYYKIFTATAANCYVYLINGTAADTSNFDNVSLREVPVSVSSLNIMSAPLLAMGTVSFAADADSTIYVVPSGKTLIPLYAVAVAGADAGATTTISIGADGAETDFLPNNTLSNLDAAGDAVILMPVPNTTPTKIKSYAAGTVIQAKITNQSGGSVNTLYLFGFLY